MKLSFVYLPLILWALHQLLGVSKGDSAYAQLAPILTVLQATS